MAPGALSHLVFTQSDLEEVECFYGPLPESMGYAHREIPEIVQYAMKTSLAAWGRPSGSLRLRPVGGGLESIKEDRVASPRLSHWALCAERCEDLDKTAALLHKIGANTLKRGGPRLPARLLSSLFCRSQRNEVRVPVRPGDASLEKSH
jgi:hypothetical protein